MAPSTSFGNSQVTCAAAVATCTAVRAGTTNSNNNSFVMEAIDADGDGSTSNSTMSTVTFPADATVRFAGLYWGSCNNATATRANAKLRTPAATGYGAVIATQVDAINGTYQSFLDVTTSVATAGPGDYWFADMTVCTGSGAHSGWSLVVVWEHSSQPLRNLTVFDGYGQVTTSTTADRVLNIPVSGFLTPPAGPVNLEIGLVSYEGDSATNGDGLFVDTTPDNNVTLGVTDGVAVRNPQPNGTLPSTTCTPISQTSCNAFNSTISDQGTLSTARNPSYANTLGFDIDEITADGLLANSSTSMELTLTTAGDFYYPGVVTTAVDLYAPAFPTITKTVVDLNGGPTLPGDQLEYGLTISNIGQDGANSSIVSDAIPLGTSYVPGSINYAVGPNAGVKTDSSADDQAEYLSGTDSLRFRIGTGADATSGGVMGIGATQTVTFRVTVDPDAVGTVDNQYRFDYVAQTIGQPFAYNSNVVSTPVVAIADISVTKAVSADPVLAGDLVTFVLTGANAGPSVATNVVITDVLPAGVTFVASSAGCSGTTTVTCALGDIAVGAATNASVTVRVDAALAIGALIVNGASITADTGDLDPSDNTTLISATVATAADLEIVKSVAPDPMPAGAQATYSIAVTNNGPSVARDAVAVDALPVGLTYVSHSTSHGACTVNSGYVDCALGDLLPSETATVQVVVDLDPAAVGPIVNSASTGSSTTDLDSGNDTVEITTPVVASADVRIEKAAVTDPMVPGEPARWTLTVTNDGPSDAQNVRVVDNAPSGVTFTNAAITAGSCSTTAAVVECAVPTLPAGSSVTVTIDGDVAASVANGSSLANTATITSDTADPTPGNNESTSSTAVAGDAVLELTKAASPDPLVAGSPLTYTLTVRNLGPSDANPVTIVDTLPAGITFNSAPGCTHAAGVVTCTMGTLVVGDDAVVAIVVDADPGLTGPVDNSAVADSPASDPVTATVTSDVVAAADLEITKAAAGPVVAGQPATWTIEIVNHGPSNATSITVADTMPAGMIPTSASAGGLGSCSITGQDVVCTYATLGVGQTRTVTIVADTAPDLAASPFSNDASVSAATPVDLTPSNNSATGVIGVSRQSSLTLIKTGPATATAGETVTWTVEVDNAGPSSAEDVEVTDLLPTAVTLVSTSLGLACSGEPLVTCSLGDLAPGASVTIELVALVGSDVADATVLSNTAQASTITPDNPADNADVVDTSVVTQADFVLSKSAPASATAGRPAEWTITVRNDGPSDAVGVDIVDVLPAGAVPTAATTAHPGATCTIAGQQVACDLGVVPAGATVVVVVAADIASGAADGATLTNQAAVSADTTDPDTSNNEGEATVTVVTEADLSIDKVALASPVSAGDEATWLITILNHGPSSAANVTVADSLPAGVTLIDMVPSIGGCVATTCQLGNLGSGALATISVRALVDPAVADGTTLTNSATVSSDTTDPDAADNAANAAVTVATVAELVIDKNHTTGTGIAGLGTSWTITVENRGPSAARDVQVTDLVPAGVSNAELSIAGVPCVLTGCDLGLVSPGEIVTLILTGDISSTVAAGSVLINTASVASSTVDPDPATNDDTGSMTVSTLADLSIEKSVVGTIVAGQPAQWELVVRNDGPSAATDVVIEDVAPAFVDFISVSGSPGCGIAADTLTCAFSSLAAGASVTLLIDAAVDSAATGSIVNDASVNSVTTDPDTSNNTSTTTTVASSTADLTVTKVLDGSLVAGAPAQWTITVANEGPSVARDVSITDTVPTELGSVAATPSAGSCSLGSPVTCALGDLNPGASATVVISGVLDAAVATASIVVNSATGSSSTPDADASDNVGSASNAASTSADVNIDKVLAAGPVVAGEPVSWTITVDNDGPSEARDVQVGDLLPAALVPATVSVSSSAASCSAAGLTMSCDLATLAPDASVIITVTGTIDANATGSMDNTATVTSTTPDPDGADNSSSVSAAISAEANLGVTKTASPLTLTAGRTVTYTIEVENFGPSTAVGVEVTDTLPTGLTLVEATTNVGSCAGTTCELGDLPPATQAVITVVAEVDPSVADGATIVNTVAVSSATTDQDATNDAASSSNPVEREADLVLAKVPTTAGWAAGDDATYELTVTNLGPSVSGAITVTDEFPGLPFTGSTPAVGCLGTWPAVIVCDAPGLAPGASTTFTVTVQTDGSATMTTPNRATVSQVGASDLDPSNNIAASTLPYASRADLSITKTADTPQVVAGTVMIYTVRLTNLGPSTARDVVLTEDLPAGFTVASFGSCGAVITCAVGDVAPGATIELIVEANVGAGVPVDSRTNEITATSTTADPTASNNSASAPVDIVRDADLSSAKTASTASVTAGTAAQWTVTLTNNGPSTATDAIISDLLPNGVEFDGAASDSRCTVVSGLVTCELGTVAPGASVGVTIGGNVDPAAPAAPLVNSATGSSTTPDGDPSDNTGSDTVAVDRSADLSVVKSPVGTFNAGMAATWQIVVTNAGPSTASDVQLSDTLPDGFAVTGVSSSTGTCTVASSVLACSVAALAVGAELTVLVEGIIDTGVVGSLTNTAAVSAAETDPDSAGNTALSVVEVVVQADVSITKVAGGSPAQAGGLMSWIITVVNDGPAAAASVSVEDLNPVGFTATSATAPCLVDAVGVTCALGDLEPGAVVSLEVTGSIDAAHQGEVTNTATVTSATGDPTPGNNEVSVGSEVDAVADLRIDKQGASGSVVNGGELTWTITIENLGPSVAREVELTDPTQSGFTAAGVDVTGDGSCALDAGNLLCTVDELAVGDELVVRVTGTATLSGEITNVATVTSAAEDPTPATAAAVQAVGSIAQLEVTKVASNATVEVGGLSEWVVTVTNRGPDRATNVIVVEQPGAGLTIRGAVPSLGNFDLANAQWTIPSLALGASAELRVTTLVTSAGALPNVVTVTGGNLGVAGALQAQAVLSARQPTDTGGREGGGGILAFTGANSGALVALGVTLLMSGATFIVLARRTPCSAGEC